MQWRGRNRILVAGGGGGAGADFRPGVEGFFDGGYGGGENRGNGTLGLFELAQEGNGATQFQSGEKTYPGDLGVGGDSHKSSGGGGGGGYYGGAAAGAAGSGGGGGSGFIATSTSNYIITKNSFLSGALLIPEFNGNGTTIGNSGNGAVRITVIRQQFSLISYKFKSPSFFIRSPILIVFVIFYNNYK